jgi:hypothetical protein
MFIFEFKLLFKQALSEIGRESKFKLSFGGFPVHQLRVSHRLNGTVAGFILLRLHDHLALIHMIDASVS